MPPTAVATSSEAPSTLEQFLDRGRVQGHLSLAELRHAFAEAGISPAEGRSILRGLTEAGVSLAAENEPALSSTAGRKAKAPRKTADRKAKAAPARKTATEPAASPAKSRTATKAAVKAAAGTDKTAETVDGVDGVPADLDELNVPEAAELEAVEAVQAVEELEAEPAMDLDDQSSVMGDSVHTYLKSIGRRTLLTAAQEVELAKRIEAAAVRRGQAGGRAGPVRLRPRRPGVDRRGRPPGQEPHAGGQPPPGGLRRQEVHRPGHGPARRGPGGQTWA
ncbi:hypothetical protein GCM10017559_75870 [Streptosporangium longisporum]|uniref:RNA polymerase sigma-70 region 1.2 domain-containing protein n=1 Tax=Streptosporangium longisporum TaxID=46187 RepID=A0ABP6LDG6_9ACTN